MKVLFENYDSVHNVAQCNLSKKDIDPYTNTYFSLTIVQKINSYGNNEKYEFKVKFEPGAQITSPEKVYG